MTDEGKLQMAAKSWGDMKLQIGEVFSKIQVSLIPSFKNFVKLIKDGFNSAPIQYFLTHLKDIVNLVVKLIPMFVIYKTTMASINAIEQVRKINLKDLVTTLKNFSWATKESTIVTEGMSAAEEAAAVSAEAFNTALISTGVGAFAVAIGLIVGQMMEMNTQFEESIDKVTNLKNITTDWNENQKKINDINQKAAIFGQLPESEQIENYKAIKEQIETLTKQNNVDIAASINATQEKIKNKPSDYYSAEYDRWVEENKQLDKLKETQQQNNTALYSLKKAAGIEEAYFKSHKINIDKKLGGGGAVTGDATNTSALSGASGGLGQAKVINITFKDAFQKITTTDNKQLPQKGEEAVEQMIRAINNIAYNEGQTQ